MIKDRIKEYFVKEIEKILGNTQLKLFKMWINKLYLLCWWCWSVVEVELSIAKISRDSDILLFTFIQK